MDLFNTEAVYNILPYDGEVNYYGTVIGVKEAQNYFDKLLNTIEWRHDEVVIHGKHIITKRKIAWYAEEAFPYTYSNTTKYALPFTKELIDLKEFVQEKTGESFNSCLLNLYHNGDEGMSWHSDGDSDFKKKGAIGSLSFGADRMFSFKHKATKLTKSIPLEKGSLLVMKGETQTHWLHRLPPTKKVKTPRINLTFRTIVK